MDYGVNQSSTPFRMQVERDGQGRVIRKSEQVAGGEVRTLGYAYDQGGRLATVQGEYGPVESYRYEDGLRVEARLTEPTFHMQHLHYQRIAGRAPRLVNLDRTWMAHDDNGFRFHVERDGANGREQESYRYAPDYRLLEVRKGDLVINFDHDQDGRRIAKYVNGQLEEQYAWLDLVRMAAFRNHLGEVRFHYLDGERTPWAMTLNGRPFRIYSDQVGSVRVVADEQGRVVQNVRYCSFGRLLEEANPGFPMPLGFAGGLHDRDIGWVRFGFRDYDPETGRFTAPDPLGYAAGDPDLYGYCLDDPVNNVDPAGLQYIEFDLGEGNMTWYDANGTLDDSFNATSGPFGNGALPDGNYTGSNPRTRTKSGMTCPDGVGWSLELEPDFDTDRDLLRIHPDGNDPGTKGCIGVDCDDADAVWDKIQDHFESNSTIPVRVK